MHPFRRLLPPATLADAARRARHLGVGGDEVLVAAGHVTPEAATRRLADHLGLAIVDPVPADGPQPAHDAEAVLRTGVQLETGAASKPHYRLAPRGREVRRLMRALRGDPSLARRVRLTSPEALRRQVMASAGTALAERAAFGLLRRAPEKSAATLRPGRAVLAGAAAVAIPTAAAFLIAPTAAALGLQALASLLFLSWIALRLAGCFYRPPAERPLDLPDRALPLYSILVPLYREAASVPGLVAALSALDYPREKLDIKLVVEVDDAETRAAIASLGLPPHMEEVAVPDIGPRTKPKALDFALPFTRGSIIAVYDAEDLPEPGQLRRALAALRAGGPEVACVQARLAVDNGAESWISGHFAAEYAGQFEVLLPVLSALGLPILLGGTSNHFRRTVLEQVGGWDPFNVTEDADLGVRLARAGFRTVIIASATWEEAPVSVGAWLGQRTRWLKGWAQTMLVHARHPRVLVCDLGGTAAFGLAVLTAGPFAAALVHPFCVVLLGWDLARGMLGHPVSSLAEAVASALALITLAAGYAGTAWTSVSGLRRRGLAVRWWTIATIPAYWLLLSLAAWQALGELVRRPHYWRKTEHGLSRRAAHGSAGPPDQK